jgi:enoyl-CoA hydratase/carnithine racemase
MSSANEGAVQVRRAGSVQVITLDRAGSDNRVTQHMAQLCVQALEAARRDREVTGCVLTGEGQVFCTGGDYLSAGGTTIGRLEFARAFNDMANAMARLGKPIVVAVRGKAHAGGFSLLCAADMAVVEEGATLGLPEAAHGLFPFLALALVKDELPKKVLWDMVYRARLLTAGEALALHLVNEVVPGEQVLERAIALAGATASFNPDIVSLGRDLYYNSRASSTLHALEEARFALAAALKAREESDR